MLDFFLAWSWIRHLPEVPFPLCHPQILWRNTKLWGILNLCGWLLHCSFPLENRLISPENSCLLVPWAGVVLALGLGIGSTVSGAVAADLSADRTICFFVSLQMLMRSYTHVNLCMYWDLLWLFRGKWAGWLNRFNACLFYKHHDYWCFFRHYPTWLFVGFCSVWNERCF